MSNFFFGKPWQQSWTAWGVVLYAVATTFVSGAAEANLVSPDVAAQSNAVLEKVGAVAVALGLRRAANN